MAEQSNISGRLISCFSRRATYLTVMTDRKAIPGPIEQRIFDRSRRRCALCIHFDNDWSQKEGQIAHLDRNAANFAEDNFAFFCLPHHDGYDTTRRQTRNLTIGEAKTARDRLYTFIETGGDLSAQPTARARRPTLEATGGSIIDATGAVIPGDLPFQFGRADTGSVIAMRGTTVTRKDDGTLEIAFGGPSEPARFPAPTGEHSSAPNEDLKKITMALVQSLRDLQAHTDLALRALPRDETGRWNGEEFRRAYDIYHETYKKDFELSAFSLACEHLNRIGTISVQSGSANSGGQHLLYKAFAGPRSASEIADFLDCLQKQLSSTPEQSSAR